MAHYILNVAVPSASDASAAGDRAVELLRLGMWGVDAAERHGDALAAGDHVLVHVGAPARQFVGRAELASAAHEWSAAEAQSYPGEARRGVLLTHAEEWAPPVPMAAVLSRIDRSAGARADFEAGVVRITADEYETAVLVAAERGAEHAAEPRP